MKSKIIGIPPTYLLGCILLNILLYIYLPSFNINSSLINIIGVIILILGLYITTHSYISFKTNKTTVKYDKSNKLVIDGLYKFSRNPMYLGFLCIVIGTSFLSGNMIGFISPIIFFLVVDKMFIPYEEEKMENTFGKPYLEYKNKVRRWI